MAQRPVTVTLLRGDRRKRRNSPLYQTDPNLREPQFFLAVPLQLIPLDRKAGWQRRLRSGWTLSPVRLVAPGRNPLQALDFQNGELPLITGSRDLMVTVTVTVPFLRSHKGPPQKGRLVANR
jgi:hypothetical protein